MPLTIATWNVDRGGPQSRRRSQLARIARIGADVLVLTEVPADKGYVPKDFSVVPERARPALKLDDPDEFWAAIVVRDGISIEPVRDGTRAPMAVGALVDVQEGLGLLIYGSVLPWRDVVRAGRRDGDRGVHTGLV